MSEPFIAEIKMFAGNFAPRGYAFCNGQLLPIAQNTALFSLVGTTYGGDGRTTFGLPNLQDRAPMHPGNGPGLTPRRLGESGGAATHTLSANELPAHGHGAADTGMAAVSSAGTSGTPGANKALAASPGGRSSIYREASSPLEMAVASAGGGQAHENRQPYLGLNFIVALVGLYPSRN
jgi:microcystin-dependent protein